VAFAISGTYGGDDAFVAVDDHGQTEGWPSDLLDDLAVALADEEPRAATPTGPFYSPHTPQGTYLTILDLLDRDADLEGWGQVPNFPDDGDELPPDQQSGAKALWNESAHPRHPRGTPDAGQFMEKANVQQFRIRDAIPLVGPDGLTQAEFDKLRPKIDSALDAVESVHSTLLSVNENGRPNTNPITVSVSPMRDLNGFGAIYHHTVQEDKTSFYGRRKQPVGIRLGDGKRMQGDLIHEYGHYLDQQMFADGEPLGDGFASERVVDHPDLASPEWRTFVRAAFSSATVQKLIEQKHADLIEFDNGVKWPPDKVYLTYLLSPREVFARAYAQWIATKTKDRSLQAQVRDMKDAMYPTAWSAADFKPIAAALDDLFRSVHALKEDPASGTKRARAHTGPSLVAELRAEGHSDDAIVKALADLLGWTESQARLVLVLEDNPLGDVVIETDTGEKAAVAVKPYMREGHPVSGYTRHGDDAKPDVLDSVTDLFDVFAGERWPKTSEQVHRVLGLIDTVHAVPALRPIKKRLLWPHEYRPTGEWRPLSEIPDGTWVRYGDPRYGEQGPMQVTRNPHGRHGQVRLVGPRGRNGFGGSTEEVDTDWNNQDLEILEPRTERKLPLLVRPGDKGVEGQVNARETEKGGEVYAESMLVAPDEVLNYRVAINTAHEFAHVLDVEAFGDNEGFATQETTHLDAIKQVISDSQHVADLRNIAKIEKPIKFQPWSGPERTVVPAKQLAGVTSYMLDSRELFARAYAQWIAVKTGDKDMNTAVERSRFNRKGTAALEIPWQWDEADFTPIAEQFDKLFAERGWLRDGSKSTVQVRPYVREGRPVSGYTRHTSTLVGDAATGAKRIADNIIGRWMRELDAHEEEIKAMKPGDSLSVGGYSISRSSEDQVRQAAWPSSPWTIIVNGREKNTYWTSWTADEAMVRMRATFPESHDLMVAGWAKRLRGRLVNKRSDPLGWQALSDAVDRNEQNPKWQSFMDRTGIPDVILPWNEKGIAAQNMDILTGARRDTNDHLTQMNGLTVSTYAQMEANTASVFHPDHPSYVGAGDAFKPGMMGTGIRDPSSVLRHEYAHSVWVSISEEDRQKFLDLLPHKDGGYDEQRIAEELTHYGAIGEFTEHESMAYREQPHGYRTESFSEAVAVVTDSRFKRDEWAPWVGEVADLIDKIEVPK
jgi:hypothetical protein